MINIKDIENKFDDVYNDINKRKGDFEYLFQLKDLINIRKKAIQKIEKYNVQKNIISKRNSILKMNEKLFLNIKPFLLKENNENLFLSEEISKTISKYKISPDLKKDLTFLDDQSNLKTIEKINKINNIIESNQKEFEDGFNNLKTNKDMIINEELLLRNTESKIREILLKTPNVPRGTCPIGKNEDENVEIRKWGKKPSFNFKPIDHQTLGTQLDILDFENASKISGSRFVIFKDKGAKLHRALTQFLLDYQTNVNNFTEILTPYIVNKNSMTNTGQLPKFEDDLFKTTNNMYLIPTAEVTLTNIHANTIINVDKTIKYCAYTPCFRSEAGAGGKDIRGLIRQHQFHKVEMVMFSHPENSLKDLEILTNYAEKILQILNLPYRVIELCTGDLGFSSSKTYDIEVWLPSQQKYREISSCSNMSDFQARRAKIKYKNKDGKLEHVHTLNGSGFPLGRTIAAIIENYQQKDGSIIIPDALVPYFKEKLIKK